MNRQARTAYFLDIQKTKFLLHPNKNKYPNQSIFVVQTDDYVYLAPYVEEETYYFLKTIIPNKDARIRYTEGKDGKTK